MEECGVNSEWLKQLNIEKSKHWNQDVTDRLEKLFNHIILVLMIL